MMLSKNNYTIALALLLGGMININASIAQIIPNGVSQVNVGNGNQSRLAPGSYNGSVPLNFVRTWEPLWPYTQEYDVTYEGRQASEVT